ncbi:hypothetical protein MPSEU_000040400 [Mayamaea pseudoterrestris]|nr:hypothetical protein MPSEU_000040400 [Mayamaea pseudoterrestris]
MTIMPDSTKDDTKQPTTTTITEGSISMTFPAGDATKVFYNPVQVQNRDLSILMITLAGERRALRIALKEKEKQLKQERRDKLNHDSESSIKEQVEEYRKTIDPTALVSSLDASKHGLCILDALAASGLRSLRYWKEIPNVKHVAINDIDPAAMDRAMENVRQNNLQDSLANASAPDAPIQSNGNSSSYERPHGIHIQTGDALMEMYASRKPPVPPPASKEATASNKNSNTTTTSSYQLQPQWDVIDLDPYGSAAPFLDAAVQGIANGGLLCITCTDMAALGGAHPETCFGRYASIPIQRAGYLQEVAIRILLHAIASSASRYGRTMHPVLSVGMAFYVRVFVEINENKAGVSRLSLHTGNVFQSTHSPVFHVVAAGQLGGRNSNVYQAGRMSKDQIMDMNDKESLKIGGPLWLGPMHDVQIVEEALKRLEQADSVPSMSLIATKERLRGLLESCREELPDAPLYYKLSELTKAAKLEACPLSAMKAAIINAGYTVSGYHKEPQAIKTTAPNHVIFDILRAWAKLHPPKKQPEEGSFAANIQSAEPSIKVDFTMPRGGLGPARSVARFPMNPQAHWGPKRAATGNKRKADEMKPVNNVDGE